MLDKMEKFLKTNKSLNIASSSYNNPNLSKCSYVSEGTVLFIAGEQNSPLIEQIRFNPKVEIIVSDGETTLQYTGRAKIVNDYPNQEKLIGDLTKKDNLERKGIFSVDLVQIVPTDISVVQWNYYQEFKENKRQNKLKKKEEARDKKRALHEEKLRKKKQRAKKKFWLW